MQLPWSSPSALQASFIAVLTMLDKGFPGARLQSSICNRNRQPFPAGLSIVNLQSSIFLSFFVLQLTIVN
jgi:hypothetical protein